MSPSDPSAVVGAWVHFVESDAGDAQHFVPADTQVPPSLFRDQVTLDANGVAHVLCLAPTDAHTTFDGKWRVQNGELRIDVKCFGKNHPMHFTIVKASPKLLEPRPIATQ